MSDSGALVGGAAGELAAVTRNGGTGRLDWKEPLLPAGRGRWTRVPGTQRRA